MLPKPLGVSLFPPLFGLLIAELLADAPGEGARRFRLHGAHDLEVKKRARVGKNIGRPNKILADLHKHLIDTVYL